MSLSSRQRAHLRSLAHPLRPIIHIGKDGASPSAIGAVQEALSTHELLKIRVLDNAPMNTADVGRELVEAIEGAMLVQVIGHVLVIYRPFSEHPVIRIPA